MANNMNNVRALAKRCGVSTATISRVLNNKPGVSDEVRERVSQVIRECNYTPKIAGATDAPFGGFDRVRGGVQFMVSVADAQCDRGSGLCQGL